MSLSVQDLDHFLSRPAPRLVPAEIRRRAFRGAPAPVAFVGLLFLVLGLVFSCFFVPRRLGDDIRLNRRAAVADDAVVEHVVETSMKENERRVYRLVFSYVTGGGIRREGVCYRTGSGPGAEDRVIVEYLSDRPDTARIRGCRLSPFGAGAGFVVIFPVVGAAMIATTARSRRRILDLLIHGRFAAGRIESIHATNVRVNNQTVYKVAVSFRDGADGRMAQYRIRGPAVDRARRKSESNAIVGILVHPTDPTRILPLDPLVEA